MYVKPLTIGNVTLENNVLLAPMAGVTDKAFRKICKSFGAGLTYTEMASSRAIYYEDKKTKRLLDIKGEKGPISIQLFGNTPKTMGLAAKSICGDADFIDINMGCPAPKIVKNGDGSKLLLDLNLAGKIVEAVKKNVSKPVTVKMRIGYDKDHIIAEKAAKVFEQAGADAICVHGRTRESYYTGEVDLNEIRKVKESVKIPVIGNGDIKDFASCKKMFDETNVDGIMIGRASFGNPWIFEELLQLDDFAAGKKKKREISNEERFSIILKHLEFAADAKGEYVAVREMRKHISWYLKKLKHASVIRSMINKVESKDALITLLEEYFEN